MGEFNKGTVAWDSSQVTEREQTQHHRETLEKVPVLSLTPSEVISFVGVVDYI